MSAVRIREVGYCLRQSNRRLVKSKSALAQVYQEKTENAPFAPAHPNRKTPLRYCNGLNAENPTKIKLHEYIETCHLCGSQSCPDIRKAWHSEFVFQFHSASILNIITTVASPMDAAAHRLCTPRATRPVRNLTGIHPSKRPHQVHGNRHGI